MCSAPDQLTFTSFLDLNEEVMKQRHMLQVIFLLSGTSGCGAGQQPKRTP